jgi:prolyl-tRNA editing enzyme YbaK/EbsC (Cys-tRNA(Pro) deacylase)
MSTTSDMDITTQLQLIEKRIDDLTQLDNSQGTVQRVKNDLRNKKIYTYRIYKVPENYYNETLEYRANLLKCNINQLCKTIVVENIACSHNNITDICDSRYYCIIIQYIHKLNGEKLKDFIHNLKPKNLRISKKKINFQLTSEDKSADMTGFTHNAVSPFGLMHNIPVILCLSCSQLSPPYIWLGAGEVDLKLGVPLSDFVRGTNALIADISEPR